MWFELDKLAGKRKFVVHRNQRLTSHTGAVAFKTPTSMPKSRSFLIFYLLDLISSDFHLAH